VNEPAQSEGVRPSVLAIGVTPLQAMQAFDALVAVVREADLRVPDDPPTREAYSHYAERVQFVGLDPFDPIESQLLVARAEYAEQVKELLSRSPETSRFVDPLSVIVVTAARIGAGAPDPVRPPGIFARAARLLTRSGARGEPPTALARLLAGLGHAYGGGFPGPVLVVPTGAGLTFVAEPGLPREAFALAEELVTIRGRDASHLPLRWNGELHVWTPLDESWSDQAALRTLATEIQAKLPPPGSSSR
jgi:hypothetical protein